MLRLRTALALVLCVLLPSQARLPDGRLHANQPPRPSVPHVDLPTWSVKDVNGTSLPPYETVYYFDQLIDHSNPGLGTFKQRYWHTWEFYQPGGPIVLMTPRESNEDGAQAYITNQTVPGLIAQELNGATVLIEHRFFGFSNPYPDLSVKSLKFLTIQQGMDDLAYFAENVKLPMPGGDKASPKKAPWILVGGSYSGAVVSWIMVNNPGLFWAGYASSAVVQAITDYWQYWEPIRQNMPQNCSSDVQTVITHVDKVSTSKNEAEIDALKHVFGMDDVLHLDDFAGTLRNNLWDWQSLKVTSGPNTPFYRFCDALETKDGATASASGFGLHHALPAWGKFFQNYTIPAICGNISSVDDCVSTYNDTLPFWRDTKINNDNRSWLWIVCNEVGWYQDTPPKGHPALVSRLVKPAYDERQCQVMFPEAFPSPPAPKVKKINDLYKGWDVNVDRLFFANGKKDPWRPATVSADGLSIPSTPLMPIVVSDGVHVEDLRAVAGIVDKTIGAVHKQALASMKEWLADWKAS